MTAAGAAYSPPAEDTPTEAGTIRWLMLAAALAVQTSINIGWLSTPPLAPFIEDDLGVTRAQVGMLSSAVSVGCLLSLLPAGWIADRAGSRLLLFLAPAIMGSFLILASRADSYWTMLLFILLMGLGAGMGSTATTKAVMLWFAAKTRGTAMGIKQTGTSLGGAIAAAILPGIALASDWRWALGFAGALILAVGLLCLVGYRDNPSGIPKGRASPRVGIKKVLRSRSIQMLCLAAVCFTAIQLSLGTYLVLYFTEVRGVAVTEAANLLALVQISGVAGRVAMGLVSDRLLGARRKGILLFTGMGSLAAAVVTAAFGATMPFWGLALVALFFGFVGIGWTGTFMILISEMAGKEASGVGAALGLMGCNLGIVIGPPLFGMLVDATNSYTLGWLALALMAVLGTAAVMPVRERARIATVPAAVP